MAGGLLCLMVGLALAFAPATSFAGEWALDKSKSELPQMMANIEGMTLTVTQDDKQLTAEYKIIFPEGAGPGGGGGGRPGGGGGGGRGPNKSTYSLDGKKTTVSTETPNGAFTTDYEAKWSADGKTLELKTVRHVNFQGNAMDLPTTEKWELSADGKTLTVNRTSESPRGTTSSKLVFTKK
jgi:hypothetical protein